MQNKNKVIASMESVNFKIGQFDLVHGKRNEDKIGAYKRKANPFVRRRPSEMAKANPSTTRSIRATDTIW